MIDHTHNVDNDLTNEDISGSIAIIGMAGRFPKSPDLETYWQNLRDGVELISFPSDEELQHMGVGQTVLDNPNYVKASAIIDDSDRFDAGFFQINAREAELLDPQHRIFLEIAHHALEDANIDPYRYEGLVGVYAGCTDSEYLAENLRKNDTGGDTAGTYQAYISNGRDFLATRLSYKLNLNGPSVNVQTACSTSLVAVHMACQSLLGYQCDVALAGGISLRVPQKFGHVYQSGMIYSSDGHCRPFDADSQGIVGGQGAGIIILKRLEDALADGDNIHAVVKGSATNNDGAIKVGYTAPSIDGQAEVIAMAQAAAEVGPETITYVEAHGTATPLGDPIEVAALSKAFRERTDKVGYCSLGSVKSNLGHADAAAGIAGLIKTVLALKHRQLPPSLHFETPNPDLELENSPFYVNSSLQDWGVNGMPRRAGVSSFGIGGTNAHVILEEAPETQTSPSEQSWHILPLSAKTDAALNTLAYQLASYLKENPTKPLADIAHTLQVGRQYFEHRRFVLTQNNDDATASLVSLNAETVFDGMAPEVSPESVFMFTGQGAQYP
ncbi:MAG: type I polyketide synthase, partial [Chloroflexota bacterium]